MHSPNPYDPPASEAVSSESVPIRTTIFSSVVRGVLVTVATYALGILAGYLRFTLLARSLVWPSLLLVSLVDALKSNGQSPASDEHEAAMGFAILAGIPLAVIVYSGCAYLLALYRNRRKRA